MLEIFDFTNQGSMPNRSVTVFDRLNTRTAQS